ncbi:hypothetical protein EJB05_55376, partial [Eragrostis curvula]
MVHCMLAPNSETQTTLREEIKSAYEYRPFDKCDYSARISNEIRVKKLEYICLPSETGCFYSGHLTRKDLKQHL